jgi:ATP-binding cassette subfamily F protein 3
MVDGVAKSYDGRNVFDGVDLHFERGDKVAVVGVNGAGKSTLLKILAGRMEPDSGTIRLGAGVAPTYFGQHQAQELPLEYTVLETLSHAAQDMTITRMRSLLGAFLFRGEDVDKKVSILSGGEKSRLALARMISVPANCMLLDEPTNHLDMTSQEVLQEAMKQYDGTIIVVSHNRYFLDCFVNRVMEVKDGKVALFEGNVADYLLKQEELAASQAEARQENEGDHGGDGNGRVSRKEQRRLEARRREERKKLAGTWLEQLSEAEKTIEQLELEKEDLEAEMADPELYQDQKAWNETSRRYEACTRRLERWMQRWEEAQEKIDEIDAELGQE